jgi:hypothetical protein
MDTFGGLIDKLITVDMKMWAAQDEFYKIRKMTFEEFKQEYFSEGGMKLLWERFQKGIDLNLQRNALIDEIDELLLKLTGAEDDGRLVQRKHKTY